MGGSSRSLYLPDSPQRRHNPLCRPDLNEQHTPTFNAVCGLGLRPSYMCNPHIWDINTWILNLLVGWLYSSLQRQRIQIVFSTRQWVRETLSLSSLLSLYLFLPLLSPSFPPSLPPSLGPKPSQPGKEMRGWEPQESGRTSLSDSSTSENCNITVVEV